MRFLFPAIVAFVVASTSIHAQPSPAPSSEGAGQQLKDSPRHGEWVDIALPDSDVKLKSWVVYPERKDNAPVVIVIHEIFGLTDWVRSVADALAANGFIAVAPDLLSGLGPNGGGTEALGDKVREEIRKLTPEDQAKRLDAVAAHAQKFDSTTGKIASIGFCWGGSASFNYATRQPRLRAAVVYYGTAPGEKDQLSKINCPVLGLYGGNDNRVTSTVDKTASLMKELQKSFDSHVYDGAGHGFLRQQSGQNGANAKAAKEAWEATVEFLKKNLES